MDLAAARQILEDVGFSDEEIFEIVIEELAIKFAPQLRFDSGCWTCPGPDSYPMSAQMYFDIKSQNPSQHLSNGDAASITNNTIPIYWKAFQCGRQIRLVYWIFYGYQYDCDCFSGEHDADWEHILVVLSEDTTQLAAVTYYQHSGQYTSTSSNKF